MGWQSFFLLKMPENSKTYIIWDYLYFWDANFELDILSEIDLDAIADAEVDADDDDDAYGDAGDGEAVPEDNASC